MGEPAGAGAVDGHQGEPAGGAGAPPVRLSCYAMHTGGTDMSRSVPAGLLISPFRPLAPGSPSEVVAEDLADHVVCSQCGAFPTPWSRRQGLSWTCVYCGAVGQASNASCSLLETAASWRSFELRSAVAPAGPVSSGATAPQLSQTAPSSLVFLLDGNLLAEDFRAMRQSVQDALRAVDTGNAFLSVVVFTSHVTVYRLALPDIVSGDIYLDDESFARALSTHRQQYVVPASTGSAGLVSILSSLRGARLEPPARVRRPTRRRATPRIVRRGRCLQLGVRVALQLVGSTTSAARILVCTSGRPSPGGRQVREDLEVLARSAAVQSVGIDVFARGVEPIAAPQLYALCECTGGLVHHVHSWGAGHFGAVLADSLREEQPCPQRTPASLEIRTSPNLRASHLIGQALVPVADATGNAFAVEFSRVIRRLAITVLMEHGSTSDGALDEAAGFIQFLVRFSTPEQEQVLRAYSIRLTFTSDDSQFLQAVDEEVLAVILAKQAILHANTVVSEPGSKNGVGGGEGDGNEEEDDEGTEHLLHVARDQAQHTLDDFLRAVSRVHRAQQRRTQQASRASPPTVFPDALPQLPRLIFDLRRGAMLHDIQDSDITFCRRLRFLRADVEESLALMRPQLYSAPLPQALEPSSHFIFVPTACETLALWSDCAVVLDLYDHIIIWKGSKLAAHSEAGLDETLLSPWRQAAAGRIPPPRIEVVQEGSSMARSLVCRLIPSHKDAAESQNARFPRLKELSLPDRAAFLKQFPHTDAPSFREYLARVVAK